MSVLSMEEFDASLKEYMQSEPGLDSTTFSDTTAPPEPVSPQQVTPAPKSGSLFPPLGSSLFETQSPQLWADSLKATDEAKYQKNNPYHKTSDYDSVIEKYAAKYGMNPAFVKANMIIESGGNPKSTSPKAAMGLMQIIPGTFKEIQQDLPHLDNPYDPEQSIEAGTFYLAKLKRIFGDDPDVITAAYNMGPQGMQNYLAGKQPMWDETKKHIGKFREVFSSLINEPAPTGSTVPRQKRTPAPEVRAWLSRRLGYDPYGEQEPQGQQGSVLSMDEFSSSLDEYQKSLKGAPKTGEDKLEAISVILKSIKQAPRSAIGTMARAYRDADLDDNETINSIIEWAEAPAQSVAQEYENDERTVFGYKLSEMAQTLADSLGFSVSSIPATMASAKAGALTGAAIGSPLGPPAAAVLGALGGVAGASVGGYQFMKRAANDQISEELIKTLDEAAIQDRGYALSKEERRAALDINKNALEEHAMWEAGTEQTETLLNFVTFLGKKTPYVGGAISTVSRLMQLPVVKSKLLGKALMIAGKLGLSTGGEALTEAFAQAGLPVVAEGGQAKLEHELGMREEPYQGWTEEAMDVIPGTLAIQAATAPLWALGGAAGKAYRGRKSKDATKEPSDTSIKDPIDITQPHESQEEEYEEVDLGEGVEPTPVIQPTAPPVVPDITPPDKIGVPVPATGDGLPTLAPEVPVLPQVQPEGVPAPEGQPQAVPEQTGGGLEPATEPAPYYDDRFSMEIPEAAVNAETMDELDEIENYFNQNIESIRPEHREEIKGSIEFRRGELQETPTENIPPVIQEQQPEVTPVTPELPEQAKVKKAWAEHVPNLPNMPYDKIVKHAKSIGVPVPDKKNKIKLINTIKAYYDALEEREATEPEAKAKEEKLEAPEVYVDKIKQVDESLGKLEEQKKDWMGKEYEQTDLMIKVGDTLKNAYQQNEETRQSRIEHIQRTMNELMAEKDDLIQKLNQLGVSYAEAIGKRTEEAGQVEGAEGREGGFIRVRDVEEDRLVPESPEVTEAREEEADAVGHEEAKPLEQPRQIEQEQPEAKDVEKEEAIREPAPGAEEGRKEEEKEEPREVEKPKPVRFELGKSLTKEERKEVLDSIGDAYKDNQAPKELKYVDERTGEEVWGYAYSPDSMYVSDITGKRIRHYLLLPDGRKAHPSELFPEIKQSDIDNAIAASKEKRREEQYIKDRKMNRIVPSGTEEQMNNANLLYNKTGRKREGSYFMINDAGDLVRVEDEDDASFYIGNGFKRRESTFQEQGKKAPEVIETEQGPRLQKDVDRETKELLKKGIEERKEAAKPEAAISDESIERGITLSRARELTGNDSPSVYDIRQSFDKMTIEEQSLIIRNVENELSEAKLEKSELFKRRLQTVPAYKSVFTKQIESQNRLIESKIKQLAKFESSKKRDEAPAVQEPEVRGGEDQAEISKRLKKQQEREQEMAFESKRKRLLSAKSTEKSTVADEFSLDEADEFLSRLDAAPGDDPAAREALYDKFPSLKPEVRPKEAVQEPKLPAEAEKPPKKGMKPKQSKVSKKIKRTESGIIPPATTPGAISKGSRVMIGDTMSGTVIDVQGDRAKVRMDDAINPKAYVNVSVANLKLEPEIEAAYSKLSKLEDELPELQGELGADKRDLAKLLGAQMYKSNISEITVKELLQNAFDAVKAQQSKSGTKKPGKVKITLNMKERSVTVEDDGIGMNERVIKKAFFTIAGSSKEHLDPKDRSGGLGMAKMAFMFSCEHIEVDTMRDGIRYKVSATPEDIFDDDFKIKRFTIPKKSHGTKVKVFFPKEVTNPITGEASEVYFPVGHRYIDSIKKPLIGNVVIEIKDDYEETVLPLGKNFDTKKTPFLTKATFSWGEADIYFGYDRVSGYPSHQILSSGVYQFDKSFRLTLTEPIPYDIIVNIKSYVDAKNADYPFNNQREGFKDRISQDIISLGSYLVMVARGNEAQMLQDTFKNIKSLPRIDVGEDITDANKSVQDDVRKKTGLAFKKERAEKQPEIPRHKEVRVDTTGVYTPNGDIISTPPKRENKKETTFKAEKKAPDIKDFLEAIDANPDKPIFHNNTNVNYIEVGSEHGDPATFFAELGSIMTEMKEFLSNSKMYGYDVLKDMFYSGISIDKEYAGIFIKVPYRAVMLNPFGSNYRPKTLFSVRNMIYTTMVHELAHAETMSHGEFHNTAMERVAGFLADEGMEDYFRDVILKVLLKHESAYTAMRREYEKSSTKNVAKSFKKQKKDEGSASGLAGLGRDESEPLPGGGRQLRIGSVFGDTGTTEEGEVSRRTKAGVGGSLESLASSAKSSIKNESGQAQIIIDLSKLGVQLIRQGHNKFKAFASEMKRMLGDLYARVRNIMLKVFDASRKVPKSELGAVRLRDMSPDSYIPDSIGPKAEAFKKFFGKSMLTVDRKPKSDPIAIYHGTADEITAFDLEHPNRKDTGWLGHGVYLTTSPELAGGYAIMKRKEGNAAPNVIPLYGRLESPYYATMQDKLRLKRISETNGKEAGIKESKEWTKELIAKGYDGVILEYTPEMTGSKNLASTEIVIFNQAHVKSVFNYGTWDTADERLSFSLADENQKAGVEGPTTTQIKQALPKIEKFKVSIVDRQSELPEHILEEAKGMTVEGVHDPFTNTVYVVRENIGSLDRAQQVWLHEVVGHAGIEAILGSRFKPYLSQVVTLYGRAGLQSIADQYGFDLNTSDGRLKAAREKLAIMAEKNERPAFLKRLYAAIRQALRDLGLTIKLTDNDIRSLIAQSSDYVMGKPKSGAISVTQRGRAPAFILEKGKGSEGRQREGDSVLRHGTGRIGDLEQSLVQDFGEGVQGADLGPAFSLKDNLVDSALAYGQALDEAVTGRSEVSLLGKVLRSPEWLAHPVSKKIYQAASEEREEMKHKVFKEGDTTKDEFTGEQVSTSDVLRKLKKLGVSLLRRLKPADLYHIQENNHLSKEYKQVHKILTHMDVNEVHWKEREVIDKDGNPKIIKGYRDILIEAGKTPDSVIKAVDAYRQSMDKMLILMRAETKKIIDSFVNADMDVPKLYDIEMPDGTKEPYTLMDYYNDMGQLEGFYMPRIREPGEFFVLSKDKDGVPWRIPVTSKGKAYKLMLQLQREGHTEREIVEADKHPESAYEHFTVIEIGKALEHIVEKVKDIDPDTYLKFRHEVFTEGSNMLQERAFRSSRIGRSMRKGEIVRGYIEDPQISYLSAMSRIAGGIAKGDAATKMFAAIMGKNEKFSREGDNWVLRDDKNNKLDSRPLTDMEKNDEKFYSVRKPQRFIRRGDNWVQMKDDKVIKKIPLTKKDLEDNPPEFSEKEIKVPTRTVFKKEDDHWVLRDKDDKIIARKPLTQMEQDGQKYFHTGGIDRVKDSERFDMMKVFITEQLRNPDKMDMLISRGKSLVSFKYLGFNPRTIMVNMTSLFTTAPAAIHSYVMNGKGSFAMVNASIMKAVNDYRKVMRGKKLSDPGEQMFMEELSGSAELQQYTRDAMADLQGAYGRRWAKVMGLAMWGFGKSEQLIRGATMLSAYRLAKSRAGIKDHAEAVALAKRAARKAHGVYNRATDPIWAMGQNPAAKIGKMGYTYMKFAHNYLQMLYDVGLKRRHIKSLLYAMAAPVVLTGVPAIFAKDIWMALFGQILKKFNDDDRDLEKVIYDWTAEMFGRDAELAARFGLLGLAGVDVSGSLAMGFEVPKTLIDLTGPFGGVYENIERGVKYAKREQYQRAAEEFMPSFVANISRAIRELDGARTRSGHRIWNEDGKPYVPSKMETAKRAAGFRPSGRAVIESRMGEAVREDVNFSERSSEIYEKFRYYVANPNKTDAELQGILEDIAKYNNNIHRLKRVGVVPFITKSSLKRQMTTMSKPTKKQFLSVKPPSGSNEDEEDYDKAGNE